MIAFLGNRPALLVGEHMVTDYEMSWLSEVLDQAAEKAQLPELPVAHEIYRGITHYLEHTCSLKQLPLEDLFKRIRYMLKTIGFTHVADALETTAPPIELSLVSVAKEVDQGFELAFFQRLRNEVEELRNHGAETVSFYDIEDCVLLLKKRKKWSKACDLLEQEIVSFIQALEYKDCKSISY